MTPSAYAPYESLLLAESHQECFRYLIRIGFSSECAGAYVGDLRCASTKSPGSRLWREPGYDAEGGLIVSARPTMPFDLCD